VRRFHAHSTEQDVPYDLAVELGDQRKQNDALMAQPVGQVRFVSAAESGLVHFPDLLPIPGLLVSDKKTHLSSFSSGRLICKQPGLRPRFESVKL
jgi:hypothetical protein